MVFIVCLILDNYFFFQKEVSAVIIWRWKIRWLSTVYCTLEIKIPGLVSARCFPYPSQDRLNLFSKFRVTPVSKWCMVRYRVFYYIKNVILYLDEMVVFLRDEFQMPTTTSSIRRALASKGWSKKNSSTEGQGAKYRLTWILSAQAIRFPILSPCLRWWIRVW